MPTSSTTFRAATAHRPPRLLVVPGLHDSGPAHWQSWLQAQFRDARRVVQDDWSEPNLERWSARIDATLATEDGGGHEWLAVAHSFGCLALVRHLALRPDSPIRAVLLVAPAEPDRFGVGSSLPSDALPLPATVVTSDTDPWMSAASAAWWAQRWNAHALSLGDAGHINTEAGFGPLPLARRWVQRHSLRQARAGRAARADLREWSFAR